MRSSPHFWPSALASLMFLMQAPLQASQESTLMPETERLSKRINESLDAKERGAADRERRRASSTTDVDAMARQSVGAPWCNQPLRRIDALCKHKPLRPSGQ